MEDKPTTAEPGENPYQPPLSLWRQIVSVALIVFFGGAVVANLMCVAAKLLWPNALRGIAPGDLIHNVVFAAIAAVGFSIRRAGS